MRRVPVAGVVMAAVLCAPAAMAPLGSSSAAASGPAGVVPTVVVGPVVGRSLSQIPSSEFCLEYFGFACYTPSDIQNQYDFPALYGEGITGAGQTIVIFDSFGSPTIRQDLAVFDQESSLPDPPSFDIYMPEGSSTVNFVRVPKTSDFDHNHLAQQRGWAYETTLDVEWAHALAPGANIALVTIPLSETGGVQGLPNMQHAQAFALSHGLGSIWSDSWSATEQGFGSATPILNLDRLYAQAAAAGVSAFFGTGDTGSANVNRQGHVFPYATVTYPPSSAHVVAVGGTGVTTPVGSISTYQPESVWDTPPTESGGGGGYSSVFPEPSYQVGAGIPDPSGMRGIPDVSMNAADTSAVLVFESFDPLLGVGFVPIAGTSEATPLWAATDAVMNQADGPLGFLTPRLYQIYENPGLYSEAFHDITVGNNSVGGVPGFSAGPGWDAASGLGTPDAVGLAQALAQTTP